MMKYSIRVYGPALCMLTLTLAGCGSNEPAPAPVQPANVQPASGQSASGQPTPAAIGQLNRHGQLNTQAVGGGVGLPLDSERSLQVTTPGFTNRSLRHAGGLAYTEVVDDSSSDLLKADSTFKIVRGLADPNCYSLEAKNFPGSFLRHQQFRIKLMANDNSDLFKNDATFCAQAGLSGTGISLESMNLRGSYIRHQNAEVWLAQSGGPNPWDDAGSFKQDASWNVISPVPLLTDPYAPGPILSFSNEQSALLFGTAYTQAVHNLVVSNQVRADSVNGEPLRSGLLTGNPATVIRAGGGYNEVWTRDASVNSWNAASLITPDLARNTLWSVAIRQPNGQLIEQQDNQLWDQVIWITAAWNHYLATGDRSFLADAYTTAVNTLAKRRDVSYNASLGLFEGPSFFNDGVSGYPVEPADESDSHGSFILDYPRASREISLSTNTLYYAAYANMARMAAALNKPASEVAPINSVAASLKDRINQRFWMQDKGTYGYMLHNADAQNGLLDDHQEGTGLAFAVLFGIADQSQAASIVRTAKIPTWGIADIYPAYPRYSEARPGRHNVIVWPVVQGFWAEAEARIGAQDAFAREVARLAKLSNYNGGFWEIYNAQSGVPDGGWQVNGAWDSKPDQTWSASAYLRMIYNGIFGITLDQTGMKFQPTLPTGWGDVSLNNVKYRGAQLNIQLHGAGNLISAFSVDGNASEAKIPDSLTGRHKIEITLSAGVDNDRDGDGVSDSRDGCADEAGPAVRSGCPGPSDGAHLLHPQNAPSLVLDDRNASTAQGNPIVIWENNQSAAQSWMFDSQKASANGFYTIKVLGNYCLTATDGNSGSPVTLQTCNDSSGQSWRANATLRGYTFSPAINTKLCLDVKQSETTWGMPVQVWDCNRSKAQQWNLD